MMLLLLITLMSCFLQRLAATGSCPVDTTCIEKIDSAYPQFRRLSYTDCKQNAGKLIIEARDCASKNVQDIIGKKQCECTNVSLFKHWFLISKSAQDHAPYFFCMRPRDSKLSTCPAIVRTCERLAKEAARHTNMYEFGRTCSAKGLEYKGKLLECLKDLMETDLSGCGSLQDAVKQYGPFVKILLQVHCSGCDIPALVETCARRYKGRPERRQPCSLTRMADHVESCFVEEMQTSPSCQALAPTLKTTWQEIKENTLVKALYEACALSKTFHTERAGWGCSSDVDKRDSPTLREFLTPTRQRSLEDLWSLLTEE